MEIIEVVQEYGAIEHWMSIPARGPDADLTMPPFLAWTFAEADESVAMSLRQGVDTFQGTVAWELRRAIDVRPDGKRWTLMPARVRQHQIAHGCNGALNAAGELKTNDPNFGIRANAELAQLAAHLQLVLRDRMAERGSGTHHAHSVST